MTKMAYLRSRFVDEPTICSQLLQRKHMKMLIHHLKEVSSTNDYLRHYQQPDGEEITLVWSDYQQKGRGCGTNRWESEAGKNLTFSLLFHPTDIAPADQFILSMANALALKDTLAEYTDGITIKWPNDIYWHDLKLCGTLIETSLGGQRIKDCIIGNGININQRVFLSDAPNPVSMAIITGHEIDREAVLHTFTRQWLHYYAMTMDACLHEQLRTAYRTSLYRRDGTYDYMTRDGEQLLASIHTVEDDGHLVLACTTPEGQQLRRFDFKEVIFSLPSQ